MAHDDAGEAALGNRPRLCGIGPQAMKKKSAKAPQKKAHKAQRSSAGKQAARKKIAASAHQGASPKRGAAAKAPGTPEGKGSRRWSADAARRSNALDLERGVFTRADPREIAASLKRSAETSLRKKTDSFRSAMSMLNFYINRAGANLSTMRRRILTRAKDELRRQFGR